MPNPTKYGRCIKELERIYGIRDGSAGKVAVDGLESNNFTPKTEADLAEQLGMTRQTLQNYKALADSIPEIQTLIETGIGNTNPVKFGRCIKELERIYGIKNGNNQFERVPQVAEGSNVTQSDLASQFGMSVDTLNRYKQLADSIPEIQTLVETGIVTPTTACPGNSPWLIPGRLDLCSFFHCKMTMVT